MALAPAVLLGALLLLDFFVLRPLQESGALDRGAVIPTVLLTMLALPGLIVGRVTYITSNYIVRGDMTSYYLVTTAVTAALTWALAWLWFRGRPVRRAKSSLSRRAFLRRTAQWAVVGGGAALGSYSVLVEPRWLQVRRERFVLPGLPRELSGLRVLHLSDLHLGRFVTAAYLTEMVRRCNTLGADLVLLTGDYVHGSPRFIEPVFRILAGLRPRLGSAGVLGNHDHWEDAAQSRRQMRAAGIHLVDNTRVWVSGAGLSAGAPPRAGLCVGGLGDFWEDRLDLNAALGQAPRDMPRLLLSHNPDFAESPRALQRRHRVDLMLAGHTHGGQVRLPGTGALITPSRYGAKYAAGFVKGPAFPVHVSAGVGVTILPVRLLVRPEVVLIELVSSQGGSSA